MEAEVMRQTEVRASGAEGSEPASTALIGTRTSAAKRACKRCERALLRIWWRRTFAEFGAGSHIDLPAFVMGGRGIRIGPRVTIWRQARIEARNTEPGATRIAIGEGTVIQPFVHIGAASSVEIGRQVLMASHVYITDHDHDYRDPAESVITNRKLIVAPVRIGDGVWLGERVMVLKGVTIGEKSIIGAGSIVTKDVPAYSIAVGSPARVVRRYDRDLGRWVKANGA